jgi:hypothetical protein
MKNIMMFSLMAFSTLTLAQQSSITLEPTNHTTTLDAQEYTYATPLDIAKVISMDAVPNVCEVVPMTMTYEDSAGRRHVLNYRVMGTGCTN